MMRSGHEPAGQRTGIGRRRFLAGLGVGVAGVLTLDKVEALAEIVEGPVATSAPDPRFSRMFELPAFADPQSTAVQNAMMDIGKPDGLLDAKDPLSEGPVRLITDPELSPGNLDQDVSNMTAGTTFVGQFLDHDVTFDNTSRLGVVTEPTQTPNTRVPRLDLDSVYGGGPSVSPQLYRVADRATLRFGDGGLFEDLPRNPDMTVIIADPRNDENLMIAGLHAAFLLAHNRTVNFRRKNNLAGDPFVHARRTIMHHWQWIVVNEFLPQIVGRALVKDILRNGRRWYRFSNPTMPCGVPDRHLPVRAQPGSPVVPGKPQRRPRRRSRDRRASVLRAHLRSGGRRPGRPDRPARWSARTAAVHRLADVLRLRRRPDPARATEQVDRHEHLHTAVPVAAGYHPQPRRADVAVAAKPAAAPHLVAAVRPTDRRVHRGAGARIEPSPRAERVRSRPRCQHPPVVLHLREASVFTDGVRLGPLGGRIVAETIIGMLQLDKSSYLNTGFRPSLPSKTPRTFTMTDLLRWARVDPASRGQ